MELAAGWKDFLRPVRDGFRHLFPTPDTGPTPEERARQRELDRLKGFSYFDTIKQLEAWAEAEVDPVQIANTPLLPRSGHHREGDEFRTKVLVCHDYAGNYHDYEASQGIGVDMKSYACEYMQFVDTFVYFSHKLVCVPPASWTNTLHRNGVYALGTVLIEPQTRDTGRLLQHNSALHFPIAEVLASIAQCYGFDGWLINIEKPFEKEIWETHRLEGFLQQLKRDLGPSRKLIWYDALTINNRVRYQNALTLQNLPFSERCGAVLTNYTWRDAEARDSKQLAVDNGMDPSEVYMGIDVWAQNTTKLTHPRITYPRKDGGGTYTGIAVAKLAEIGISAGVFAPAWTFEHFPGHGNVAEQAVWDGLVLPANLDCSCGKASEHHPFNRGFPVVRFAREFAAGSERFFYTDFARSFGRHCDKSTRRLYSGNEIHSQLGSQSILPHMARTSVTNDQVEGAVNILSIHLSDLPGRTDLVVQVQSFMPPGDSKHRSYDRWLPLFKVNMTSVGSLRVKVRYRYTTPPPGTTTSFYLKFTGGVSFFSLVEGDGLHELEGPILQDQISTSNRLIEIGIYLQARQIQEALAIVEITDIHIGPVVEMLGTCSIENIRAEQRQNGEDGHWRLCWDFSDENEEAVIGAGQPYSRVTGPFSYFVIDIHGISATAFALEWIICQSMEELLVGKAVDISITGIGFDGRHLATGSSTLRIT